MDGFSLVADFTLINGRYSCQAKNRRITLYMAVVRNGNMAAGTSYGIGNISSKYSDYMPSKQMLLPCIIDNGSSVLGIGVVNITTAGVFYVTPLTNGTTWRRAMISACWDV